MNHKLNVAWNRPVGHLTIVRTKETKRHPSPYAEAMGDLLKKRITAFRKEGTVAMGVANLSMFAARTPSHLKGAPTGANARWMFHETFKEVVAGLPAGFRNFVIEE